MYPGISSWYNGASLVIFVHDLTNNVLKALLEISLTSAAMRATVYFTRELPLSYNIVSRLLC